MKRAFHLLLGIGLVASSASFALGPGDAAPALRLASASGQSVELDKLRGKVVYVDFWASWCGPCKRSFPWMNDMLAKYRAQGLEIVAVNVDRKREDAERFLAAAPAQFTVVYDASGSAPAAWQVKAMPTSYLIDANGTIALVESGFRDERKGEVEDRIRAVLAAGPRK
jgi:cytochrome c biogenesis protein CcmG, thiol:disulfide interchange protein DsbE